jgi:predicted kinase
MPKPALIIVNGLPGAGKTTLAHRLGGDLHLPVFSRDGLYETLYDALPTENVGAAAYPLMYYAAGIVLAAGQSVIVEGFFGRPDVRTAEFLDLQRTHDFAPLQILCEADGAVLLERFLARLDSRHAGHADAAWLEANRERLLSGTLEPLALAGPIMEIDTTTPNRFDYDALLQQVRSAFA